MQDIKKVIRESRSEEVENQIKEITESLQKEEMKVEFGKIGTHTTYAMIYDNKGNEIVGYTFIKDMRYYRENVGKLKALQQAIARKKIAETGEK